MNITATNFDSEPPNISSSILEDSPNNEPITSLNVNAGHSGTTIQQPTALFPIACNSLVANVRAVLDSAYQMSFL